MLWCSFLYGPFAWQLVNFLNLSSFQVVLPLDSEFSHMHSGQYFAKWRAPFFRFLESYLCAAPSSYLSLLGLQPVFKWKVASDWLASASLCCVLETVFGWKVWADTELTLLVSHLPSSLFFVVSCLVWKVFGCFRQKVNLLFATLSWL